MLFAVIAMSFACVLHFAMSSCASHFCIRVRLLHSSIFPVVRFAIRHSYALRRPPFVSRCEWVLNFLGMDRGLPSGLGTGRPPVKFRAIRRSFGTPTVNRVTVKPLTLCSPTPLPKWPKTHLTPLHALGRSITIAWPKTALHLDTPSSLYLYIYALPVQIRG